MSGREKFGNAVLDVLPEHIAVVDRNGLIVAVNKAWIRYGQVNGGRPDGYVGSNYLNVCTSAKKGGVLTAGAYQAIRAVIGGMRPQFSLRYPCHTPSEKVWFDLHILALTEPHGGAVAVHTNVTENHVLSEFLQKATEQFARVFHRSLAPSLLVSLDDLRVLDVNRSFLQLTEYDRVMVDGKVVSQLGLLPLVAREAWRHLPSWDEAHDFQVRTRSGKYRTVTISAEAVEVEGKAAVVLTFKDVTEYKNTGEQLAQAIKEVMQDTTWLSYAVLEKLAEAKPEQVVQPEMLELTERERQVLQLMATGMGNEEIAGRLGIANQTVRNYISRLYSKLDVHTRAEAVVWARERGLVDG